MSAALATPLTQWFPVWLAAGLPAPHLSVVPVEGSDLDRELVERMRRGDRRAFDELFRRHADEVYRRLTHLIGPDPEREDLVQEIFLSAYRGLDRFRGDARFSTWLHKVVVNSAFGHLRKKKRRPLGEDNSLTWERLIAPGGTPEAQADQRQALMRALAYLDRLKPKKRIAFVLRVVEGLPLSDIATLVDATPAAVGQRVKHAQAELEAMVARDQLRHERRGNA